jgi:hypothetical protein
MNYHEKILIPGSFGPFLIYQLLNENGETIGYQVFNGNQSISDIFGSLDAATEVALSLSLAAVLDDALLDMELTPKPSHLKSNNTPFKPK